MRRILLFLCLAAALPLRAEPPSEITFTGDLVNSPIASGVQLPAGRALFYTSGTVPPILDKDAKDVYGRYGDTKTQGIGALKAIEKLLAEQGLGLKDVIYLRAAYGQFFGTAENPVKPARSTVGVAGLVSPDWLIEIEAVAAYPQKK